MQPDTLVPDPVNPQAWNRYSYVANRPVNFSDPTGHKLTCEIDENCRQSQSLSKRNETQFWKALIKDDFGITMSDTGGKKWDVNNLSSVHLTLQNIDKALNGKLASLAGGATFIWGEYAATQENCPKGGCTYQGITRGTTITFETIGNAAIRQMNIYHEFGHLLDNSPEMVDVFSKNPRINSPSFITKDGYLNSNALIFEGGGAIQHPYSILDDPAIGAQEHWADIFANYVAGNIDLSQPAGPGTDMYKFVTDALAPYIGTP